MNYVSGSLFGSIVINIVNKAMKAYDGSMLKKCVSAVSRCYNASIFHSICHRYIYKRAWFQYSLVYRSVCFLAHIIDSICGFIHNMLSPAIKGSIIYALVLKIKGLGPGNIAYLFGILLMSIPIGSIVSMIFTDSVVLVNMGLCWGIFALGMFVVLCGMYHSAFNKSLVVRFVKWLTDSVLG